MIEGFDEDSFRIELRKYFTPAQPISKPEQLYGRDAKLRSIDRALSSPGKHVFIFGDRGIGKTSLAKTAFQIHSPEATRIPIVACDNESTFFDIVNSICQQIRLLRSGDPVDVLGGEAGHVDVPIVSSLKSINDAVEAIRQLVPASGKPLVMILDEFDQLTRDTDKKFFADLIKQLSDQEINLRLILCGIGRSLTELIGTHLSTDRYLASVELQQIPHDARWKILTSACDRFGVELDRNSIIRIGQISDGFPYYVHLIGERIFWEVFDDPEIVKKITAEQYQRGIHAAVEEAQTSLRQTYDLATQKHSNSEDYEETLWSVADGAMLTRQTTEIYENSYLRVMDARPSRKALTKEVFYQRMNRLKQSNHGSVLIGSRTGWYGFRESVVRGYARLRAERAGVKIGIDHITGGEGG